MLKFALVKLEGTTRQYCFWTILDDLGKGDNILVETKKGLVLGEFIRYTDLQVTQNKANRWVYTAVSRAKLHNNLRIELEESGIDFSNPVKTENEKAFEEAKKWVEDSRDEDAIMRIMKKHAEDMVRDKQRKHENWEEIHKIMNEPFTI